MYIKPMFPSLFTSYTQNNRLESFQLKYSPRKKLLPYSNNQTKEQTNTPAITNMYSIIVY